MLKKPSFQTMMCAVLSLIGLLILLGCGPNHKRLGMERVIRLADSQNLAYDSITNVDSLILATQFFDKHGSPNERMKAHYLLASAYRDMGDAPKALEAFHQAAERADTTRLDCDYGLLCRVHGQMIDLFNNIELPYDALQESDLLLTYAAKANDSLLIGAGYLEKANSYNLLGDYDQVISCSKKAMNLLLMIGDSVFSLACMKISANAYIEKGDLIGAKKIMEGFEDLLKAQKHKHSISNYISHYNFVRGKYYLKTEQLDSAKHYFELINSLYDDEDQLERYRGLAMYYVKTGAPDSALKYSEKYVALDDTIYKESTRNNFQKLHTLYNYERNRRLAEESGKKLSNLMLSVTISVFVSTILICIIAIFVIRKKKIMDQKVKDLNEKYGDNLIKYALAKKELAQLKRNKETDSQILYKKKQEIESLKLEISKYQLDGQRPDKWNLDDDILDRFVVRKIHEKASRGKKPSDTELLEIEELIKEKMPTFIPTLIKLYPSINRNNILFCIFIKLRFISSELQIIFNLSPQAVTNRRSFLYKSMFGEKGGAKEFDAKLLSICSDV